MNKSREISAWYEHGGTCFDCDFEVKKTEGTVNFIEKSAYDSLAKANDTLLGYKKMLEKERDEYKQNYEDCYADYQRCVEESSKVINELKAEINRLRHTTDIWQQDALRHADTAVTSFQTISTLQAEIEQYRKTIKLQGDRVQELQSAAEKLAEALRLSSRYVPHEHFDKENCVKCKIGETLAKFPEQD